MRRHRAQGRAGAEAGFTIIELMISTVIFTACIVTVLNALSDSMNHYNVQSTYAIMQMDARRALETISRDLRMAGRLIDPVTLVEYPYTFINGAEAAEYAHPAVHPAPDQHVPVGTPGFGDSREIGYKIPQDLDGDGFLTDAATGLVEWCPHDVALVLVTGDNGINSLQRWENNVNTQIVAHYVERITFDTIRTDPTIDWNAIVVTIYMARPTPRGVWLQSQLSTTIKMRNTDEAVKPVTGWELEGGGEIIDIDTGM